MGKGKDINHLKASLNFHIWMWSFVYFQMICILCWVILPFHHLYFCFVIMLVYCSLAFLYCFSPALLIHCLLYKMDESYFCFLKAPFYIMFLISVSTELEIAISATYFSFLYYLLSLVSPYLSYWCIFLQISDEKWYDLCTSCFNPSVQGTLLVLLLFIAFIYELTIELLFPPWLLRLP